MADVILFLTVLMRNQRVRPSVGISLVNAIFQFNTVLPRAGGGYSDIVHISKTGAFENCFL